MHRRTRLGVAAVALLLLVGATVYVFIAGQSSQGSATYLAVEPSDENVSANETIAYEQLSPAQQDLFERARNSTDLVEVPPDVSVGVFIDNWYVRYQNRTYEVAVASS